MALVNKENWTTTKFNEMKMKQVFYSNIGSKDNQAKWPFDFHVLKGANNKNVGWF